MIISDRRYPPIWCIKDRPPVRWMKVWVAVEAAETQSPSFYPNSAFWWRMYSPLLTAMPEHHLDHCAGYMFQTGNGSIIMRTGNGSSIMRTRYGTSSMHTGNGNGTDSMHTGKGNGTLFHLTGNGTLFHLTGNGNGTLFHLTGNGNGTLFHLMEPVYSIRGISGLWPVCCSSQTASWPLLVSCFWKQFIWLQNFCVE